jgi:hypothetical protein
MDARIRNFVWHGQFTTELGVVRAWLDADLAALPRTAGGLAIPDLRVEVYAMAATTVSQWAEAGTAQTHIVGDVLFHNRRHGKAPAIYITPESGDPAAPGIPRKATLWKTGRDILAQAGAPPAIDLEANYIGTHGSSGRRNSSNLGRAAASR